MKAYSLDKNLQLMEIALTLSPRIAKTMIAIAHRMSLLSRCPKGKRHACVIAREGKYILSTGYNGPAKGHKHCVEDAKDCDPEAYCSYSPSTNACPAVHAEENAIINAAREGIKVENCYAYVTKEPCRKCKAVLVNAGISVIIVEEKKNGQRDEGEEIGDNEQDQKQEHVHRKHGWGFTGDEPN